MSKEYKIYNKMTNEWKTVTEDEYNKHRKKSNAFRRKEQRRGHCKCPSYRWWLCDSECPICEFYIGDQSLDETIGDDESILDLLPSNLPTLESIVEDRDLLNALYSELSKLSAEDFLMCQLMANYTQTETAKILGLSRSAFRWRWDRLRTKLAKKLEKFF